MLETLFFDAEQGKLYKIRSDDYWWYIYSAVISDHKLYLKYESKYEYDKFGAVKDVLRYHIDDNS